MDEQDEEAEDEEDEDEDEDLIEDIDDNRNGTLNDEEDAENIKKENKRRIDADVKKGSSIKQQLSLWDLLLECRIKYHKTISHCNRLPQGASGFKSFTQIPGENDFVKAALAAQSAIKTFLDSSLELQVCNQQIYTNITVNDWVTGLGTFTEIQSFDENAS